MHGVINDLFFSDEKATEINFPTNESSFCPGDNLRVECIVRNSTCTSLMILWRTDRYHDQVIHCSTDNESARTITTPSYMLIVTKDFTNDTGNGTSLLKCTLLFGTEIFNKSESLTVLCDNTEIGVTANRTFQIPGKHNFCLLHNLSACVVIFFVH